MKIISFIKTYRYFFKNLRSLFKTLYFNFKCLPFKQAIHVPILLYKPDLVSLKGTIIIDAPISFGMIKLGVRLVSIYDDNGVMIENNGTIIFKDKCIMGNGTKISIGTSGVLEIGNNFCATACLKIVCYDNIKFGDNVLVGWECFCMDTDFHQLTTVNNDLISAYAPIFIGNNCWIACRNMVMKGSKLPSWSVVAANSLLNKDYSSEKERTIFAGQPAKPIKYGIYLDRADKNKSTIVYNK